jgi:hypothetical protein
MPNAATNGRSSTAPLFARTRVLGPPLEDSRGRRALSANDERLTISYFDAAASCRTVLMNVSVARVKVRSRR